MSSTASLAGGRFGTEQVSGFLERGVDLALSIQAKTKRTASADGAFQMAY